MAQLRHVTHDIVPPLIDKNSKVLVMGSILSPKSVENAFYYAHPQNRFWRVLAAVFDSPPPASIPEKTALCLSNGVALWDVIKSCDIVGAADSTVKNAEINDIVGLLSNFPNIKKVFVTGAKAYELLKKYNASINNAILSEAVKLPSPSPLNCATSFETLVSAYSVIRHETENQ